MEKYVLECSNVNKYFIKKNRIVPVLNGVNLKAKEGEIIVISGKSGNGKTVLLWILSGIDSPSTGEIFIEGKNLQKLNDNDLSKIYREKIAVIFQDFNLVPAWTVLENVQSALIHTEPDRNMRETRAIKMLEEVGLQEKADFLPSELSIGQRQRAAIARSLVNNPGVVFADEPTGGLDEETAKPVIELLCRLVHKNKSSLIVTTHGIFPLNIGDRVFSLANGSLEEKTMR